MNLAIRRTFQRTRGVSAAHPFISNLGNAGAMTSRTTSADRSARRRRGIWTSGETHSKYSRTSHPGSCSARIAVKFATESTNIIRAPTTRISRDPVPKSRVPTTRIDEWDCDPSISPAASSQCPCAAASYFLTISVQIPLKTATTRIRRHAADHRHDASQHGLHVEAREQQRYCTLDDKAAHESRHLPRLPLRVEVLARHLRTRGGCRDAPAARSCCQWYS